MQSFLDQVAGLPEQLASAHEAAAAAVDLGRLPAPDSIRNVVVVGVGGSAIAGDVLAATTNDELPVPVEVLRQYRVPAYVGPETLVFAVSYSGATEETLSMTREALERGANVVGVSAGGPLATLVESNGGLHVPCPEGFSIRAPIGALVAPLLVTMYKLGFAPGAHAMLMYAQEQLARRRDTCALDAQAAKNPARELARRIGRTIPLVYGGGALGRVAAYEWKSELNKSAKIPAFSNFYPEIDHNEIVGWGQHGDVTRQIFTVIELRHGMEHTRLGAHFEITREMIRETVLQVLEVQGRGEGRLAQLLDLAYVGSWTSAYVALENDVDPGPTDAIDQVKAALTAGEN